jgi:hypothetical protein
LGGVDSFFEVLFKGCFDCFTDDLFKLLHWFGHAKGDHGPKGQLKGILFFEKVDAAEDEAESEGKFLLAGGVERRKERLTEDHLFDVVHEDV